MSKLKLINEQNTDLSIEAYCLMGSAMYNIAAAEIIMYRMADALDAMKAKGTWFQEKKKYLSGARKACETLLTQLDLATSEANGRIYQHAKEKGTLQWADETLQDSYHLAGLISVMFFAKSEGDPKISRNMLKALGNFKVKNPVMDIDAVLDFFNYNKYIKE